MPRKPEFVAAPVPVLVVTEGDEVLCQPCYEEGFSELDVTTHRHTNIQKGECNSCGEKKPRIDCLPGVQYAEGTLEPGTHETPARIVEVPTVTAPSMEALGERRAQLRANLGHARNSVKGGR